MRAQLAFALFVFSSVAVAKAPPEPQRVSQLPALPPAVAQAALLREAGQFAAAAALLEEALPGAAESERGGIRLALAEALRLDGDPARAAEFLAPLAAAGEPLAPYARFARARALSEAGQAGEALPLLTPPPGNGTTPRLREASLRLSAACSLAAGRAAGAISCWEALEKEFPRTKAEARFRRGEVLLAAGRKEQAKTLLSALWREETGSPWGHRAGLLLRRAFPTLDPTPARTAEVLALAKAFLSGGRAGEAWDLLENLSRRKLTAAEAKGCLPLRVQTLYALRWNSDLQAFADATWASAGDSELGRYAASRALWACLRSDDAARAEALGARLLGSPKIEPPLLADTRYALGSFYFCRGDWAKAKTHLDALDALPSGNGSRTAGLYKAAWAARKSGDAAGAQERMARLAASAPPAYADPARYYLSLWQEESKEEYKARAGWESLAMGGGYWASAAREALAARGETPPPRLAPPLPPDPPSSSEEPARLAELLDAAGMTEFSAEAYEPFFQRQRTDPSVRLRFARGLARAGETGRAYSMGKADFGDPERLELLPPALSQVFYPRPFGELLAGVDGRVPQALVFAITKRESGFDPDVLSPVGAVGLMQLMPETAAKLSLGGEVLPSESDLLDPATNLRLGTAYLARLRELLGSQAASVAAYNAGEDRVAQWLAAFVPADESEFVAMIPYEETRLYTQRVLFDFSRYAASTAHASQTAEVPGASLHPLPE